MNEGLWERHGVRQCFVLKLPASRMVRDTCLLPLSRPGYGSCSAHWTYFAVVCRDHDSLLVPFTSSVNSSLLTASTYNGHAHQKEPGGRLQRPHC